MSTPVVPTSAVEPVTPLTDAALIQALGIRDLSDPGQGAHAVQMLVDEATRALGQLWNCQTRVERSRPIVAIADNYDRLGYPSEAVSRDARYTRYVSETTMLRSHVTAGIPPALRRLAMMAEPPERVLLALPGISYRRDAIDRIHTGTPHQLDLWLIQRRSPRLSLDDLHEMVTTLVDALLPGRHWRWTATSHPYTTDGREVEAIDGHLPIEIAECGLAAPRVLADAGLDPAKWSGLALGMGLDRMLMLRKGIPDIRLLRSRDPRVTDQMGDLAPYRELSDLPPALRDISIAVAPGTDAEVLGDRVRTGLGDRANLIEEMTILSRTPVANLPQVARTRLGSSDGQENLLIRLVIRPVDQTLTSDQANDVRDAAHAALHEGS